MVWWLACSTGPTGRRFKSALCPGTLTPHPPVIHGWVNKVLGVSSRACVTEYIKYFVPLIEKSRALCPGGRFLPSFIHQVIITGLNKLYD